MSPRPRANHAQKLRQTLALIPWLLQEDGASVAELCERFGLSEKEVLWHLEAIGTIDEFGDPGFYVAVTYLPEEGIVSAHDNGIFSRPLQLPTDEGLSVLAAGRTMLEVPGADPTGALASAMDKLETALHLRGALAVDIDVPNHYATVLRAVEDTEALRIEYFSAWRDEISERRIEPLRVFSNDGRWYVIAHDDLRDDRRRRFRIDRILSAEPTGEHFEPDPVDAPTEPFVDSDATREVTIELPATARWVIETYEERSAEELPGGGWRVVLPVTGEAWLERLLLRVGPEARVVDPPEFVDLAARAAARLLALYAD